MSSDDRLRALEARVDLLTNEVAKLRDVVAQMLGTSPAAPPIAQPNEAAPVLEIERSAVDAASLDARPARAPRAPVRPTPPPQRSGRRATFDRNDLEAWIGRYGTLALASITILLGVGAFLSWAIASGRLGPSARVILGAIGAVALAVVGWRLRRRPGAERFGSILLALALAVVHVVAWGAGPKLQLVPWYGALAIAALASAALSWLALREEEQTLFNVGFGGALLAPFVTSTESVPEHAWRLLGYGLLVLGAGVFGARGKTWSQPPLVFVLGCAVYTASAAAVTDGSAAPLIYAPGVFALACAWLALALMPGTAGARTSLAALTIETIFLVGRMLDGNEAVAYAGFAALTLGTSLIAVARDAELRRSLLVGAFAVPAGSAFVAMAALEPTGRAAQGIATAAWTIAVAAFGWGAPARSRAVHLATATLIGGAAFPLVLRDEPQAMILGWSLYCVATAFAMAKLRSPSIAVGTVVWLVVAAAMSFTELSVRTDYQYTPFLTIESFGALACAGAWIVTSYLMQSLVGSEPDKRLTPAGLLRLGAALVTFLWGRQELARAYSPDASVLLLIVYYAVAGLALIFLGRVRGSPNLRRSGLALAIYAALKAVFEASGLEIGFRVGSYLLAGVFLLGVAYWYRLASADTTKAAPAGSIPQPAPPA
jgi:uncharacterized membrane protein